MRGVWLVMNSRIDIESRDCAFEVHMSDPVTLVRECKLFRSFFDSVITMASNAECEMCLARMAGGLCGFRSA